MNPNIFLKTVTKLFQHVCKNVNEHRILNGFLFLSESADHMKKKMLFNK